MHSIWTFKNVARARVRVGIRWSFDDLPVAANYARRNARLPGRALPRGLAARLPALVFLLGRLSADARAWRRLGLEGTACAWRQLQPAGRASISEPKGRVEHNAISHEPSRCCLFLLTRRLKHEAAPPPLKPVTTLLTHPTNGRQLAASLVTMAMGPNASWEMRRAYYRRRTCSRPQATRITRIVTTSDTVPHTVDYQFLFGSSGSFDYATLSARSGYCIRPVSCPSVLWCSVGRSTLRTPQRNRF